MRMFTMYRRDVAKFGNHDENQMNPENEPQFEGVVFSDGRCSIRWLTAKGSTSVWDTFDDMMAIHGHPEYGSVIEWDEQLRDLRTLLDTRNERIRELEAVLSARAMEDALRVLPPRG